MNQLYFRFKNQEKSSKSALPWGYHMDTCICSSIFAINYGRYRASQVVQWVKNLLAMPETQETQVQSLGWEDPLEEGIETHSSILAWKIPWTEEPGRLQSRVTKSRTQMKQLSMHAHTWYVCEQDNRNLKRRKKLNCTLQMTLNFKSLEYQKKR